MSNDNREAIYQPGDGVWVSYYSDYSGIYVHRTELDALRAAIEPKRDVVFVRWGEDIRDAWKLRRDEEAGQ